MRITKLFSCLLGGIILLYGCGSSNTFRQKWTKQKHLRYSKPGLKPRRVILK